MSFLTQICDDCGNAYADFLEPWMLPAFSAWLRHETSYEAIRALREVMTDADRPDDPFRDDCWQWMIGETTRKMERMDAISRYEVQGDRQWPS